jgi:hypothetical protein
MRRKMTLYANVKIIFLVNDIFFFFSLKIFFSVVSAPIMDISIA